MNEQAKYFVLSSGLHGILLAVLLVLAAGAVHRKDVVTIDFSFDSSPPIIEPQQAMKIPPATPPPARLPDQPEPVRQAVVQQEMVQQAVAAPSISSTPIPTEPPLQHTAATVQVTQPATGQVFAPSVTGHKPISAFSGAKSTAAVSTSSNAAGEASVEQIKKKYLKEQFNYIRNMIVKQLTYPPIARRMDWSGKVVLAFVIDEGGGVNSIRIKESSGYPILDNSATNTVRNVAPFPRPPVAAEIIIPVQFKLE